MHDKLKPDQIIEFVRRFADRDEIPLGELGRACRIAIGGETADDQDVLKIMVVVAALIRQQRGIKGPLPPPVALVRKKRSKGVDWLAQKTWLGGLPTLGGQDWPRGRVGQPLHHIARIDLAEVHLAAPELPLPSSGVLSFFFTETDSGSDGAVSFSPPGDLAKTPPPSDLPPAYEENGYPFPTEGVPGTSRCFPYWPLEAIKLDLPASLPAPSMDDNSNRLIWDAQLSALHAHFPDRRYDFGVETARSAGVDGASKLWWYGAFLMHQRLAFGRDKLADSCRRIEALLVESRQSLADLDRSKPDNARDVERRERMITTNEANLAELQRIASEVGPFAEEFTAFLSGHDPWDELENNELEKLEEYRVRLQKEHRRAYHGNPPFSLDAIRNLSVERLFIEKDDLFERLPDDLVKFINDRYRTPTRSFHHMFGLGVDVQEAPYRHLGDHLLLQIVYDSLVQMKFGDVGAIQFWVSAEDLAAQRWDKVRMTFEGH